MFSESSVAEAMRAYLLETAPVFAIYLDAKLDVVATNPQARQVLRREALGRPFAEQLVDFTGSIDLPSLIAREGAVHRLTLATASGLPETLRFRFFPLSGGVLALGGFDFEEQRRLRNEVLALNRELNNLTRRLHQANAELCELNALKNQFIGMAAHDLRQPLGAILAYTDFVLDEAGDCLSDEHREFLRASVDAVTGMDRLIDDFLDVSVIESGHLRLERSRTDLATILAAALPLVRRGAAKKKIELLTEVANEERSILLDSAKVQQVLVNLLNNALEHSQPGDRVWLVARRDDAGLAFSVRDEGPGITIEDQKRLFQAFVRAGTRKTSGERSVGLGLAIARMIVEAHGGRIGVESYQDKGSTFSVNLPTMGVERP